MKHLFGISLLSVLLLAVDAHAAPADPPTREVDTPCSGCRVVLPPKATTEKVPLLVVMHGDWGLGPADLLHAWERHALKRDVAVLSLQCPKDLGCRGSWWRWNGDPAWVTQQIDALSAKHPNMIDKDRLYLAGWSGGASYMGMRAQQFQKTFAAMVYHGGGVAPGGACVDKGAAPVGFLVGNANPLHQLAVQLRDHHQACNDEVLWKMIPKADHPQEWQALDTNGGALVDWMLKKKRTPPSPI